MEPREILDRKSASLLVIGAVAGFLLFYGFNALQNSPGMYAEDLVQTLEQSSGQNLELVKTESQNGLYRIQVSDQNDQLTTYYKTRDGERLVQGQNVQDFNRFKQRVSSQAEFASCMENRGVVMFGNQSQRATLLQTRLLGGANQVSGIYADVNNQQVLQQAVQAGIQRTPAFFYNGSAVQGVQSIQNLEQFTGCTYNGN